MTSAEEPKDQQHIEVAIVGGGIVGVILAIGLLKRNIKVQLFEQARSFREIGAGVAFTANAIKCMHLIEPAIVTALKTVATSNGDPNEPTDYLQWADGFNQQDGEESKILFRLDVGPRGFEGCHRAHLLAELIKLLPAEVVHFQKRVLNYTDDVKSSKRVELRFEDNSTATVDAASPVIACDGIKSRVRQVMIGEHQPSAFASFTHKCAYRALIPMEQAIAAVGEKVAMCQRMHIGPGAHVLHFPVNDHKLLNVVAFVGDPEDWHWDSSLVASGRKGDLVDAFARWGPTVRSIIHLLDEHQMDRWAIFDMAKHPADTYAVGRVCLAGDAAHASAPHHGAGGGIGVEDALAMSHLLELSNFAIKRGNTDKTSVIQSAFQAFDKVRQPRTQWFVQSSRDVCNIYEMEHPETRDCLDKIFSEITWRSHKIWYFDIDGMLSELTREFHERASTNLS